MIYEGVNFNEPMVASMTKSEFEIRHINLLWPDKPKETRRQMLEEVYDLICPPPKKTKGKPQQ